MIDLADTRDIKFEAEKQDKKNWSTKFFSEQRKIFVEKIRFVPTNVVFVNGTIVLRFWIFVDLSTFWIFYFQQSRQSNEPFFLQNNLIQTTESRKPKIPSCFVLSYSLNDINRSYNIVKLFEFRTSLKPAQILLLNFPITSIRTKNNQNKLNIIKLVKSDGKCCWFLKKRDFWLFNQTTSDWGLRWKKKKPIQTAFDHVWN